MAVLIDTLNLDEIRSICDSHGSRPDSLLEILHDVQAKKRFLSEIALREIAKKLNISRAEIHGVVTFYHDFKTAEPAKHTIKVCRAEACQAVGSEELAKHIDEVFSVGGSLRAELGTVDVETVYCLGNCALGPAIMIDGELYGRLTPDRFDMLARRQIAASTSEIA
jgi:formate dehydrogenase subunit gamma